MKYLLSARVVRVAKEGVERQSDIFCKLAEPGKGGQLGNNLKHTHDRYSP